MKIVGMNERAMVLMRIRMDAGTMIKGSHQVMERIHDTDIFLEMDRMIMVLQKELIDA